MWQRIARTPRIVTASCGVAWYLCSRPSTPSLCQLSTSSKPVIASSVASMRKEYSKKGLNEIDLPMNPIELFGMWLIEAKDAQVLEPNAMCLCTSVQDKPSGRIVLLKDFDERGFVWFTNYNSRKGSEIASNPNAALTFWWGDIERSVRIEGTVEKISPEDSTAYHLVRPVDSQIGAWSSQQSQPIDSREALTHQEKEMREKLTREYLSKNESIPRPPHWGGYRLNPTRIEFWKGREGRMHDRIVYVREVKDGNKQWRRYRLQP